MRVSVLPIAERELRVAARSPKTHRSRWVTCAIFLVVAIWAYFTATFTAFRGGGGASVFSSLSNVCFILCLFAGVGSADALSSEKREGTLGLLFLTDLRGYDIVVGKLFATSLQSLYTLIGVIPILGLPILIGGVQGDQFIRVGLSLIVTLFFSVSVGLFFSSMCVKMRSGANLTNLTLVFLWMGWPAACQVFAWQYGTPEWLSWARMISPANTLGLATGMNSFGLGFFWSSLGTNLVTGLGLLTAAAVIVPRAWQDKAQGPKTAELSGRWRRWRLGTSESRKGFRTALLDRNPFFWLICRSRFQGIGHTIGLAVVCLLATGIWLYLRPTVQEAFNIVFVTTAFVVHLLAKLRVAGVASQQLGEDRQTGSIELLLSTPLTVPQILRGQWLGLLRLCGPSTAVALVLDACAWGLMVSEDRGGAFVEITAACAAAVFFLLADFGALGWVSMWLAMKGPLRKAAGGACLRILFLPWACFYVSMILILVSRSWLGLVISTFWFPFGLYLFWSLAIGLLYTLRARRELLRDFRTLALTKLEEPPRNSLLSRLFSRKAQTNIPPVIS